VPWILNAFFKLIQPFIDPVTREKMTFNPHLINDGIFEADMVMTEWSGAKKFEYVHEKYWPALVETCESRRKQWRDKWLNMGGVVGLKEWDFKSGSTLAPRPATDEKSAEPVVASLQPVEAAV
jgi:hypothetical protein